MTDKIRILIAEDENIIAKDISRTLERLGYEVLDTSRTAEAVIEKAKQLKPDLVLMDIVLEGKETGIYAAQVITSTMRIPIIFLTALTDNETLQQAKITDPLGYVLKPFDERTLHLSIEMALYKHKINQQLKERTRELEEEKNKSNELLLNIFPKEIVRELKGNGFVKPMEFNSVTLLFTDFQDFTSLSLNMEPQELVNELNDIFKNFDSIIDRYGLEKLKTMGDSYIIAGGIPDVNSNHAERIILAAIELHEYLKVRNRKSKHQWIMRAGVHSGNVVAGIVGKRKYSYEVWGKTVNVANIMERNSEPGKINISETTYNLIKDNPNYEDRFGFESHGNAEIPGYGSVKMYFVNCTEGRN